MRLVIPCKVMEEGVEIVKIPTHYRRTTSVTFTKYIID